jgi:hypothetical protein
MDSSYLRGGGTFSLTNNITPRRHAIILQARVYPAALSTSSESETESFHLRGADAGIEYPLTIDEPLELAPADETRMYARFTSRLNWRLRLIRYLRRFQFGRFLFRTISLSVVVEESQGSTWPVTLKCSLVNNT